MTYAASATSSPTVVDTIAQVLRRWPDRIALEDAVTGRSWTYRQLQHSVAGWRAYLRGLGLREGDGVALFSDNCPQIVGAMLGVISGGQRYTALHPLISLDDLLFTVDDAQVDTLLVRRGFRPDVLNEIRRQRPDVTLVDLEQTAEATLEADVSTAEYVAVDEDAIAMLTYTGGTTGRSKGVIQTHRSVVQCFLLELADWPWPSAPRFLAATPLSHGARQIVLPVFWHGGSLVVAPGVQDLGEIVRTFRIDSTFLVPSMLYRILDEDYGAADDFGSLKAVIYGGGPTAPARLAEAVARYGQIFTQLYGQAEAPATVTTLQPEDHDPARTHLFASCGRPTPTTVVELLGNDGHPVSRGAVGEICVRGRLVMAGYWNRPDETREALAGGWLHTGDLASRDDDGYLYIVDRKKDMIVSGGSNVFSREVEDALVAHPDVVDAAVVGISDPAWGEAVTAAVVLRPHAQITPEGLREFVRGKKGPVQTPKRVLFVDALPLTGLGKPDKRRLRALLTEPPALSASHPQHKEHT